VDILFALSILSVLPCALCGKNDRVSGEHATKELTVSGRILSGGSVLSRTGRGPLARTSLAALPFWSLYSALPCIVIIKNAFAPISAVHASVLDEGLKKEKHPFSVFSARRTIPECMTASIQTRVIAIR
jgi:hypothetical protein